MSAIPIEKFIYSKEEKSIKMQKKSFFLLLSIFFLIGCVEKTGVSPIEQARIELVQDIQDQIIEDEFDSKLDMFVSTRGTGLLSDSFREEFNFQNPTPALNIGSSICTIDSSNLRTCDDGTWRFEGEIQSVTNKVDTVSVSNGIVFLSNPTGSREATLKYLVNLKDGEIRTNLKLVSRISECSVGDSGCESASITFGGFRREFHETGTYNIEFLKDTNDENRFIYKENGIPLEEFTITTDEAFLTYGTSSGRAGGSTISGGTISISLLDSRPYFSCQIDNNEVIVQRTFTEGSVYSKADLPFKPTKYCPVDMPAIIRDFKERGIATDFRGSLTWNLALGAVNTVPEFQSHTIRYIAKFQEGMAFKCDPFSSEYDSNSNQCIKTGFEQDFIYQEATSCSQVTCNADFEEFCEDRGGRVVCIRPFEKTIVIRNVTIITAGRNQTLFKNSGRIGDVFFFASTPKFICPNLQDYNSPKPSNNCWETTLIFNKVNFTFIDQESKTFNEFITIEMLTNAHFESDENRVDRSNKILRTTFDFDFIDIIPRTENLKDYFIIRGETKEMCFDVNNKLGISFSSAQAGYTLLKTTDLIFDESRITRQQALPAGMSEYCLPVEYEIDGLLYQNVQLFIDVNGERFFIPQPVTYSYEVVDEIPIEDPVLGTIECPADTKAEGGVCIRTKFQVPIAVWIIGGLILVSLIVLIFVIINRKK